MSDIQEMPAGWGSVSGQSIVPPAGGRGPLQRQLLSWIRRYPGTETPELTKRFAGQGYEPHSVRRSIRGLAARGAIARDASGGWSLAQACATEAQEEDGK